MKKLVIPALLAILALIVLGFGYHYLSIIFLSKVDSLLMVNLEIQDLVIEKGYGADSNPQLLVEFNTSRDADTYIRLGDKRLFGKAGRVHRYTLNFGEEMFGETVDLDFVAEDGDLKDEISRTVTLPKKITAMISIS